MHMSIYEALTVSLLQSHGVSPEEVLSNLQAQVEAGNVLYIETNGVGCYADPRYPPTRSGKMMGRKSTAQSKTGDLVGKVVMAVREIVERKKETEKNKKGGIVAHHLSQLSPLLGTTLPAASLSANCNNNRNVLATMKDILLHVQQSACVVASEEDEGITPAMLKAAVKRAVMRGFLNETGKYYSIDNSKEFHMKGRKRRHLYDSLVPHDMSHLLIEDDGSSDSSDSSFLSFTAITSPPNLLASPPPPVAMPTVPHKTPVKSPTKLIPRKIDATEHNKVSNSSRKLKSSCTKDAKTPDQRVSVSRS